MNIAPSNAALMAENRMLKAQLQAARAEVAPISIDPAKGEVRIRNYATDSFTVDRLDAQSPAITEVAQTLSQVDQWIASPGGLPSIDLPGLLKQKVSVEDMLMTIPFKTMNDLIPKIAGPKLKDAGIANVSISAGDKPNELELSGRVKKFVEVGFKATGELSVTPNGQPRFELTKTRVAGLPMPNFLTTLATALFGGEALEEAGVHQRGAEFTVDTKKVLPPNIEVNLTHLSVNSAGLVIEGGAQ